METEEGYILYILYIHRLTWFGTLDLRGRFMLDTPPIWFTIG